MALTTLLISMLVPSLGIGRQHALSIECQSNLSQIGKLQLSQDRWGTSAYDIGNNTLSRPTNDSDNSKIPPIRVSPDGQIVGGGLDGFTEKLEIRATEMPENWRLVCPIANKQGINSYGIYYKSINLPTDSSLLRPSDIIFGCSDYKVVDVARNFATRHFGKTSFFFADYHVQQYLPADRFSDAEYSKGSNRKKHSSPHH